MKRCNLRSCFLAKTHHRCCYQQNDPNDARGYISPAWAIYDAFNGIARVAANAVSLTVCNCSFVSATVSHNYSDIGTIEVDARINPRHAQVDAIQTINTDELAALMWFERHRTKLRRQMQRTRVVRSIAGTSSPRYLRKSVFKNQFLLDGCSD